MSASGRKQTQRFEMKDFKCLCGHTPSESSYLYCVTKESAKESLWSAVKTESGGMGRLAASFGPVSGLLFRCPDCDRIYLSDSPDGWKAYRPEQS